MNEKKIMRGLKQQKIAALDCLIAGYTGYVTSIVYSIIGQCMTREDIEEAVSDSFLLLWRHAASLDSEKGFKLYLGAIPPKINCAGIHTPLPWRKFGSHQLHQSRFISFFKEKCFSSL